MTFSKEEIFRVAVAGTLTVLGAISLRTSWDNTGNLIEIAKECKPNTEQTCRDEYVKVTKGVVGVLAYAVVTGMGVGLSFVETIARSNKELE